MKDYPMKKDIELDNLLEEHQNLLLPININMEELSEEEQIIKAMKIVEGIKKGEIKVYPIDTLWEEI